MSFERALARHGSDEWLLRAYVNNLMAAKRWSQALAASERAEAANGEHWRLDFDQGKILTELGEAGRARRRLLRSLRRAPKRAQPSIRKALSAVGGR